MFSEVDMRNPRKRRVTFRDVAVLYGHRPRHKSLWYLSPYEFVSQWEPVLLTYPQRMNDEEREDVHAKLTSEGKAKLERNKTCTEKEEMEPGVDYVVKEGVDGIWLRTIPCESFNRALSPCVDT